VGLLIDVLSGQLALTGVDLSRADSLAAEPCRGLVDNLSEVVYVHDLEGNFLSANKAIQPLTGFSREEVLRMRLADLLVPESADLALRMTANNLGSGSRSTYEIGILRRDGRPLRLEAFCGPFMSAEEFGELETMRAAGLGVHRFTPALIDYLAVADLSISLAGYNTCMNLLNTGVPALVLPYSRQREQPWRVQKLIGCLPMIVLGADDLEAERIASFIERGLELQRRVGPSSVNLDGAAATARLLADL